MPLKGPKVKFLSLLPSGTSPGGSESRNDTPDSSQKQPSSFSQLVKSSLVLGSRSRSASPSNLNRQSNPSVSSFASIPSSSSSSLSSPGSAIHPTSNDSNPIKPATQSSSNTVKNPLSNSATSISRQHHHHHHSGFLSAIMALPSSSSSSLKSTSSVSSITSNIKHRSTRSAMNIDIASASPPHDSATALNSSLESSSSSSSSSSISNHRRNQSAIGSSASLKQDTSHQSQPPTSPPLFAISARFPLQINSNHSTVSRQPSLKQDIYHPNIAQSRRSSLNASQHKPYPASSSLRSPPLTAVDNSDSHPDDKHVQKVPHKSPHKSPHRSDQAPRQQSSQQSLRPPAVINFHEHKLPSPAPSSPRLDSSSGYSRSPSVPSSPNSSAVKETNKVIITSDPVSGRKLLNKYEIIRELGRGQHGKVKLAIDTETDEQVAIKIVDRLGKPRLGRSAAAQSHEDKVRQEIAIMKKCSHPNIVRLIEVLDDSSKKIYMVLEYLERGEINWQDKNDNPIMTLDEARDVARDVASGLEYLHFQGIVHRDIKPANLLRDKDGTVKISDFGVSYASNLDNDTNDELELAKTAGTPAFFAPELCTTTAPDGGPRPPITYKIDVWAFGVTLFCLVFGKLPFSAENEYELFDVISSDPLVFPDEVPVFPVPRKKKGFNSIFYNVNDDLEEESLDKNLTQDSENQKEPVPLVKPNPELDLVKDLLRKFLEKDPVKRIDLDGVKHHTWMMEGMDNASLEHFLTATADEQRIVVTNEEVQKAVVGLGTRIKRGLSRLGTSALQFAGFRHKTNSSSSSANNSSNTSRSQSRDVSRGPSVHHKNRHAPGSSSNTSSRGPIKVSRAETARHNKKYFDQTVFSSSSGHESDFSNTSSSRIPSSKTHSRNTSQNANDSSLLMIDQAIMNNRSASSSFSSLSSMSSFQSSGPPASWHSATREHIASALGRGIIQNRDPLPSGGVPMSANGSHSSYTGTQGTSGSGISSLSGRHSSCGGSSSNPQSYAVEVQRQNYESENSPITPMADITSDSLLMQNVSSSVLTSADTLDGATPLSRPRLNSDTPSFLGFRGDELDDGFSSFNANSIRYSGYESSNSSFANTNSNRNSGGDLGSPIEPPPPGDLGHSAYKFGLSASASNLNLHGIIAKNPDNENTDEPEEIDPNDPRTNLPSSRNISNSSTFDSLHAAKLQKSIDKSIQPKFGFRKSSLSGLDTACPSPSTHPFSGAQPTGDISAYSLNTVQSDLIVENSPGLGPVSHRNYPAFKEKFSTDSTIPKRKHYVNPEFDRNGANALDTEPGFSDGAAITNPRTRATSNLLYTSLDPNCRSYSSGSSGEIDPPNQSGRPSSRDYVHMDSFSSNSTTTPANSRPFTSLTESRTSEFQYPYARSPSKEFIMVDDDFVDINEGNYDTDRDELDESIFQIPKSSSNSSRVDQPVNKTQTDSTSIDLLVSQNTLAPKGKDNQANLVKGAGSNADLKNTNSPEAVQATTAESELLSSAGNNAPAMQTALHGKHNYQHHQRTASSHSYMSQIEPTSSHLTTGSARSALSGSCIDDKNSDSGSSSDDDGELTLVVERKNKTGANGVVGGPTSRKLSVSSPPSGSGSQSVKSGPTGNTTPATTANNSVTSSAANSSVSSPTSASASTSGASNNAGSLSSRSGAYSDSPLAVAAGKVLSQGSASVPMSKRSSLVNETSRTGLRSAVSSRAPSQTTSPRLAGLSEKQSGISIATTSRLTSSTKVDKQLRSRGNTVSSNSSIVNTSNKHSSQSASHSRVPSSTEFVDIACVDEKDDVESVPLPDTLAREMETMPLSPEISSSLPGSMFQAMSPSGAHDDMEHIVNHHTLRRPPISFTSDSVPSQYAYLTQHGNRSRVPSSVPTSPVHATVNMGHHSSRLYASSRLQSPTTRHPQSSPFSSLMSSSSSESLDEMFTPTSPSAASKAGPGAGEESEGRTASSKGRHSNMPYSPVQSSPLSPNRVSHHDRADGRSGSRGSSVSSYNTHQRSRSVAVGEVQYHRKVTTGLIQDDDNDDYKHVNVLYTSRHGKPPSSGRPAITKQSLGYGSRFGKPLGSTNGESDSAHSAFGTRTVECDNNSDDDSSDEGLVIETRSRAASGVAGRPPPLNLGAAQNLAPAANTVVRQTPVATPAGSNDEHNSDGSDDDSDGSDGLFSGTQRLKNEAARQNEKIKSQQQLLELQQKQLEKKNT